MLPTFSFIFYETFKETALHTEFAGAERVSIPDGNRSTTRLFCERLPFCNGFLTRLFPRSVDNLEFLQSAQCANADDLAVASSSFRDLMVALAPACRCIDYIAGFYLNFRKCCRVQYGNEEHDSLRTCISENCEEFHEMKIVRHAKYVGRRHGHFHRWTAARKKFNVR